MTDIKYTTANLEDKQDLISLWNTVFEDSIEYIENFMNYNFNSENIIVAKYKEKIVSAYYFIPVNFENHSAYYLYAAATLPEYRKMGIMGELLKYGMNLAQKRKIRFVLLSPANESLYNYYEKFGFKTVFYIKRYLLNLSEYEKISESLSEYNLKKIIDLREKSLADIPHVSFNEKIFEYLISESKLTQSKILISDNAYIYFDENLKTLHIKEYFPFNAIFPKNKAKEVILDLPLNINFEHKYEKIPQGMLIDFENKFNKDAYLGITMG
ncbi:MAG: GNAT family N-acetyltransferase [Clostridia bacterium]|nr:GNAT family N-acetyltransferase [Clostridia bacterium]